MIIEKKIDIINSENDDITKIVINILVDQQSIERIHTDIIFHFASYIVFLEIVVKCTNY
jgi:hypothetical protein